MSNKKQDNHNGWFHAGGKSRAIPRNDQSKPNATFKEAVVLFFQKYSQNTGYASRKEYWWVQLSLFIVYSILLTWLIIGLNVASESWNWKTDPFSDLFPYYVVAAIVIIVTFFLIAILPQVSLSFRRLHDAGFSGGWFYLNLIPFIGPFVFTILTMMPSKPEKRKKEWESKTW